MGIAIVAAVAAAPQSSRVDGAVQTTASAVAQSRATTTERALTARAQYARLTFSARTLGICWSFCNQPADFTSNAGRNRRTNVPTTSPWEIPWLLQRADCSYQASDAKLDCHVTQAWVLLVSWWSRSAPRERLGSGGWVRGHLTTREQRATDADYGSHYADEGTRLLRR
jgi:hypothetical protein